MNTKTPLVSIIMGSTSDYPIMETAAKFLDEQCINFEIIALSAHRTPEQVIDFATHAHERGVKVIIAAAGMAAHLPGIIAAMSPLPVIGVPIRSSLEGLDATFAILQMPPGIPVATMAINGALNASIFALQVLGAADPVYFKKVQEYRKSLDKKIVKANEDLKAKKFEYRVN